MRNRSAGSIFGLLAVGLAVLVSGCATHRTWGPPTPDTLAAVRSYLAADDAQAERMLPMLRGRPFDDLANAVHFALSAPQRAAAPVGKLPGQRVQVGDRTYHYALYVPETYREERAYPLIICLHGAGFGGETYLDRWKPRLGNDYILACPTIRDAAWWTDRAEALVMEVLAEVSTIYWVDPNRIFLTGMSNGGTGVFVIGLNHADRFAALAPMASALPVGLYPLLENARNSRFYIIHGARDAVMPVTYSRNLVSYLKQYGFQVVYREHEKEHPMAGGHFFPQEELPDLVEWLSVRHRAPVPDRITMVRDRDHTGRLYWLRIDESRGAASFWASEFDRDESRRIQEGAWARIEARISDNTISVTTDRVARYTLLLGPEHVNFNRRLVVVTNGSISRESLVPPDPAVLLREARRTPDPDRLVFAEVSVTVPPDTR